MKKITKLRGVVAALIFTLSFSTVASAKSAPKTEPKNNKNEKVINKERNDKSTKELEKINSKLDKIEKDIKFTSEKIDKYFTANLADQETENTEEVANQDETNQEGIGEEIESQDETTEEEIDEESEDETSDEEVTEETVSQDETTEEEVDEESEDETSEEEVTEETVNQDETTEEEVDEESEDAEEEENISGYSFIGKLNSLNNRLDAVKKQMNSPSGKLDKTSPEYTKVIDRIAKLKKDISDNTGKLKNLESPVLQKLKNKMESQREYAPKNKLVETNKTWTVKFNKNVNLKSFNGTNIFVVDSDNTLVETKVTFDKEAGAIKITPVENYIKGKKYTLFISQDVKSDKGAALKQATKVPFEIK